MAISQVHGNAGSLSRSQQRSRTISMVRMVIGKGFHSLILLFILLWTIVPFIWLLLTSFQTNLDVVSRPFNLLPEKVYFGNYINLVGSQYGAGKVTTPAQGYKFALRNSLIISSCTTLLALIIGILGGYAFSRINFKGKTPFFYIILTMQMFPFIAMVIPLYMVVNRLGLRDNMLSLILVDAAFISPYVVWIMRNFFDSIPRDLEDAALIDGAGRMQALYHVILPLTAPGIVAASVYSFLASWNDFFAGLTFTATIKSKPVTVLMTEFSTAASVDIGLSTTGAILAVISPILLAVIFQRYLVKGLISGAVKG